MKINWNDRTTSEISEIVATQIMGWKRRPCYHDEKLAKDRFYDIWWDEKENMNACDVRRWDPLNKCSSAEELKNQVKGWVFSRRTQFMVELRSAMAGRMEMVGGAPSKGEEYLHATSQDLVVAALRASGIEVVL